MKILQICNKMPYPPKDGGAIATLSLSLAFTELGHDVTILAMNTPKHYSDPVKIPESIRDRLNIISIPVDPSVKFSSALMNLFTSKSYHIKRFSSTIFSKALIDVLKSNTFDVVQLEGLYLTPYIEIVRQHSKAKIALRAHNIEHEIWERLSQSGKNPFMKSYLKIQAARLKKYETSIMNKVDQVIAISDKDARILKTWTDHKIVHVVPFGVDSSLLNNSEEQNPPLSLFHIGSLDWLPNQEGLNWFLKDIWPVIQSKYPELQFHIAGRNPDAWHQSNKATNINLVGEVDDAHQFMRSHGIMIVPLLSGSGMRVKIIEAMALGKTVITTSIGLEGINASDKKELFIANDASEFVESIEQCLTDPGLIRQIGMHAQEFIKQNFDRITIAKDLIRYYN